MYFLYIPNIWKLLNILPAGEQSYNRSDRYGNPQFCTLINKHNRTGPVLYLD